MDTSALNTASPYASAPILLITKHEKSRAVGPPFREILGASVLEYYTDTDAFGTFSGEIPRLDSPVRCARRKCEKALQSLGKNLPFVLASEGSFGPHPQHPFLPCDSEILYFMDQVHGFELHVSSISETTNHGGTSVGDLESLRMFAQEAWFPSHGLMLRPHLPAASPYCAKGITSYEHLEKAFLEAQQCSEDGLVWVATDMRALFNPSRMHVIGELATKLAQRLASPCPCCKSPGWGRIGEEQGLECARCGSPTALIKKEIFGCPKCPEKEKKERSDGLKKADPGNCSFCNP